MNIRLTYSQKEIRHFPSQREVPDGFVGIPTIVAVVHQFAIYIDVTPPQGQPITTLHVVRVELFAPLLLYIGTHMPAISQMPFIRETETAIATNNHIVTCHRITRYLVFMFTIIAMLTYKCVLCLHGYSTKQQTKYNDYSVHLFLGIRLVSPMAPVGHTSRHR